MTFSFRKGRRMEEKEIDEVLECDGKPPLSIGQLCCRSPNPKNRSASTALAIIDALHSLATPLYDQGRRALVRSGCQGVEHLIDRYQTLFAFRIPEHRVVPPFDADGSEQLAADCQRFSGAEAEEDLFITGAAEAGRGEGRRDAGLGRCAALEARRKGHMRATVCPLA